MVLETAGHSKAPFQCIPIPSRLFRADPSVNKTGIEALIFEAFLIASSRLEIITGAAGTHGALENASIFSFEDKSKSLKFSAMRRRGEMNRLFVMHIVRLIFQNRWWAGSECHLMIQVTSWCLSSLELGCC